MNKDFFTTLLLLFFFLKKRKETFEFYEADSFFLLKWNVFSSNKFFLVKLTLSKLN